LAVVVCVVGRCLGRTGLAGAVRELLVVLDWAGLAPPLEPEELWLVVVVVLEALAVELAPGTFEEVLDEEFEPQPASTSADAAAAVASRWRKSGRIRQRHSQLGASANRMSPG
jgi:hypothetical protein